MASPCSGSSTPLSYLSPSGDTPGHQDAMDNYDTSSVGQDLDEDMQTDDSYEETIMGEGENETQEPESDDASPPQTGTSCHTAPTPGNYDSLPRSEAENTAPTLQQRLKELNDKQAALDKKRKDWQDAVNVEMAHISHKIYDDIPPLLARLKEKVIENYSIVVACPGQFFPLPDNATTQASQSGNGKYVPKLTLFKLLLSVGQCLENIEKSMEGPEQMEAGSMALFGLPNEFDFTALFPQPQNSVLQTGSNFASASTGMTTQIHSIHMFESLQPNCDQANQAIGNVPDVNGNTEQFNLGVFDPVTTGIGGNVQGDVTGNPESFGIPMAMNQGNLDNGNALGGVTSNVLFDPIFATK